MNKSKIKRYGIFVVAALVVVVGLYYTLGEFSGNSIRVKSNLQLYKAEYNELVQKFLDQDKIKNIAFNENSQIINQCNNNQLGSWSCATGSYPEYSSTTLANIDAVLDYLEISKEEYTYYANFLRKYKLNGLGKDNEKRYVEIEDKLDGLRYYEQENVTDFISNSEYLSVKKLDEHWFLYYRDWN